MCAGRSTFCLVKGTNPDNLGFALVTSRKPCPLNGVCVKEPAEPSNWPSHTPWPPVQSWPHNYKFPADYNFPDIWPFMWQPIPLFSYLPDQIPVKKAPGPSTKLTSGSNGNIPQNYLVNNNGDQLQNGGKEVQVSSAPNYGNSHQTNIPIQGRGNYLLGTDSNINIGNGLQNDQPVAFKYEDADQIFKITPLNILEQKNSLKERKKAKTTKAKYNKDLLKSGYAPTPVQYRNEDYNKIENGSLKTPSHEMQPVQMQNQTQVHQQQQQQQQQRHQQQQHLGDPWQMEIPQAEPLQVDTPWIFSPPLFLSQIYALQPQPMYQQKKPADQYLFHRFKKPNSFYTSSKQKHHHHKRRDPSLFTWLVAKKFNGKQKVFFACKFHKTYLENLDCIF